MTITFFYLYGINNEKGPQSLSQTSTGLYTLIPASMSLVVFHVSETASTYKLRLQTACQMTKTQHMATIGWMDG